MKIESTGWTVSDIFEGSDDTKIEIDSTGQTLVLCTVTDNGTEAQITFHHKDFIALRHAMQAASGKAAELRNEQLPTSAPAPSPFDLMREQLAGWQESAAENHEALGHRSEFVQCCRDLTPYDVRTLIDAAEEDYAKRTTAASANATAATA